MLSGIPMIQTRYFNANKLFQMHIHKILIVFVILIVTFSVAVDCKALPDMKLLNTAPL